MSKIHNPVVLINKSTNNAYVVAVTDGSQNYQDARLMASMELDMAGDDADTWSRVGYYMAAEIEALRQHIAEPEARAVNLQKRSVGEVMQISGFSRDYAEGWCAGNDNAIHEIRAAGIGVNEE
ncbi:hypothetical protein [Citrobacter portucalensis]|uniref:hypothetical protein n=1 Tax=Citrobacter portucalensis TaxID=1639133 RepID=UPI001F5B1C5E|nr:hypothetical protein [Citrobacter portucalensis]